MYLFCLPNARILYVANIKRTLHVLSSRPAKTLPSPTPTWISHSRPPCFPKTCVPDAHRICAKLPYNPTAELALCASKSYSSFNARCFTMLRTKHIYIYDILMTIQSYTYTHIYIYVFVVNSCLRAPANASIRSITYGIIEHVVATHKKTTPKKNTMCASVYVLRCAATT